MMYDNKITLCANYKNTHKYIIKRITNGIRIVIKSYPYASTRPWYKEHKFCNYHGQKVHDMSVCIWLKYIVQDMIYNEQVTMWVPIAPPNQHLGIFKDPLPRHNINQVGTMPTWSSQVYHELGSSSYQAFVGFFHAEVIKQYEKKQKKGEHVKNEIMGVAIPTPFSYESKSKSIPFEAFVTNEASIMSILLSEIVEQSAVIVSNTL